jgi:hypothetical protein
MSSKKNTKTKKKQTKSKTFVAAKKLMKKAVARKRAVKAKPAKKSVKKKAPQKVAFRTTAGRGKNAALNTEREIQRGIQSRQRDMSSGRQSGDLQGLSRAEEAGSESVEELIEEGNPLEAAVVSGVEEADNADEREVHTHEVPEDDVPEEYFEKE